MHVAAWGTRRSALLGALLLLFGAVPAVAQSTGKIQGRVTDAQTGQPIVGAQVVVVGTTLGNITNEDGFYFINNVPAGVHDIQAQYIGYQTVTVREQRVLAGQTMTVDFQLSQTAVAIQAIEVVGERQPLVPRDQVSSKNIVTGETVDQLPVDDVRQVLALQPGVVDSDRGKGVSIRGGRSGEEAVYVDGILVRSYNYGQSNLKLGTNALAELDVLTGGFSAEYGEAQSGIINYVTRSGSRTWSGALSLQTDELSPKEWSVGFNRAEVSIGGPLIGGLSFFGAATATGQRSEDAGKLWRDVPIYVANGIDTVVTVQTTNALGLPETRQVAIPKFVLYDEGGKLPFSNRDEYTLDTKLDYTYGSGSRIFVSAKRSRFQERIAPIANLYNPQAYSGARTLTDLVMLGWTQNFVQSADQALAFDLKVAYSRDQFNQGALDPEWEQAHRAPALGFTFSDFKFLVDEKKFPVNEELLNNWLENKGRRTPFDIARASEFSTRQEYRLNPYGALTGFPTAGYGTGTAGTFEYALEEQLQVRAAVDWQANRYHRFKFGGDWTTIDLTAASIRFASQQFSDLWIEKPTRASLFVQDRIDLGDLVIEAGLRYDRFDPNTEFAAIAGSSPKDPYNVPVIKAKVESAISPRLGVSFPVTDRSTFRLSYGHFAQVPDLNEYYQGKNVNYFAYRNTNTNDIFGRPLKLGKTIAFEFGYRQLLGPDFVLDIAAYNRDKISDVAIRKLAWEDPTNPGVVHYLNTLTNADFGVTRGVDVRVDRRFGRLLNVMLGYSFQDARNTGTDPYTYTNIFARVESNANQLLGLPPNPPQAIRMTEENRRHNFTGNFSLHFPTDYDGPAALRDLGVFGTFRVASGLPFTLVSNVGLDVLTGPPTDLFSGTLKHQELSTGRLPMLREFDLRLSKGLQFGGLRAMAFADIRNVFDFENQEQVYLTTGTLADERLFRQRVETLYQIPLGGGSAIREVDLTSLAAARATSAGGVSNEVDRIALLRAESRFGDGDGKFTPEEQYRAFLAADLFRFGPQHLVDSGRRLRLGLELTF